MNIEKLASDACQRGAKANNEAAKRLSAEISRRFAASRATLGLGTNVFVHPASLKPEACKGR